VKQIRQVQLITFKYRLRFWLYQRGRKAWNSGRDPPREGLVNYRCLSEIRDLGGASGIGESRKQVVLHHGPQKHVWTEVRRGGADFIKQFRLGNLLFSDKKVRTRRTVRAAMHNDAS